MRRLLWLVGTLLFLSLLGYFVYLNHRNIAVSLFQNYTVQFTLWSLIIVPFLVGFVLSEIRQFLFNPARLVQRTRLALVDYKRGRYEEWLHRFQEAGLRRNLKILPQTYAKLQLMQKSPLWLRLQYLKYKRYEESSSQLLANYHDLAQKFPHNLQVLIPYQRLAIELQDWGLVEFLSHEIHALVADHPDALEGFRLAAESRGDWIYCVHQEAKLLQRFPQSLIAEKLWGIHERHLLRALEQAPSLLQELKLDYLPAKSAFLEFHRVSLALAEARQWAQSGQFFRAAHLLQKTYQKTGSPVLLDRLESLFHQTGGHEKIGQMFHKLRQAGSASVYLNLVMARLLYRQGKYGEVQAILEQSLNQTSPRPLLADELRYLLARQTPEQATALQTLEALVNPAHLLQESYQCTQCQELGSWKACCPRCQHLYTYQPRLARG